MQNKSLLVWLFVVCALALLGMAFAIPVASASPVQAPPAQATTAPTPVPTVAATSAATVVVPTVTPTAPAPTSPDYLYWVIGGAVLIVAAVAFAVWYTGRRG